ncbi:hypothetical protein KB236_06940 [Levilactobacillus brevis]|uniref:Uncharacterized protein n=1 Tax=Levilactobacillus hammesii TaxID=267633 RepID=A0A921EYF0_9LACO|nr:hypothetical protein KB236_06940 [Levilactobacillus brevis]HJE86407.1 hypothetical protein [Levilactobacillus hammesii]
MNLRRVISSLTVAVVVLAIVSGFSWFTMGKRTVTHVVTHAEAVNVMRTHASQIRLK